MSRGVDTLFEGSPKIGLAAVAPLPKGFELEGGVEYVFLDDQKPAPAGIGVTERILPITAGIRWGGYVPHARARTYGVGGIGAYRKTVEIVGAGADTLGPEIDRTDFGFYFGFGFEIWVGTGREVDVGLRFHAIRAGPETTGWDTWAAFTAGYSFSVGEGRRRTLTK